MRPALFTIEERQLLTRGLRLSLTLCNVLDERSEDLDRRRLIKSLIARIEPTPEEVATATLQADAGSRAMTPRTRLPDRRRCLTTVIEHGGHRFVASVGLNEAGAVKELFLGSAKPSSGLDAAARDAAILLSIALQYGAPLAVVRAALGPGPVLAALDHLAELAP